MKKKSKLLFTNSLTKFRLVMRLSLLLSLVGTMQIYATTYSQSTRISIDIKNVDIREAFREIERTSGYSFLYYEKAIDLKKDVTIQANNKKLGDVLSELLEDTKLSYTIIDNKFIVISPENYVQQKTITGTVKDATSGDPLPGVNVIIEGTTIGVITDIDGKFSIDVPSSNAVLVFSFVGYTSEKMPVLEQSTLTVSLVPDIQKLDEVIVVGYGTSKKSDISGSVASVSRE